MVDFNDTLLELIEKKYTINDIAKTLNLSHRQLYYRLFLLKNNGTDFSSKYYSNGETILVPQTLKKLISCNENENAIDLITKKDDNVLKTMIISDIHKFNNQENEYCLDMLYDYCKKQGINIILNCGDLIEGMGSIAGYPTVEDISEQVDRFIDEYPFDENILNFVVLGNHDTHPLVQNNQDFKTVLENKRKDIVPLGYRQGVLNVKDDRISLNHTISEIPCNTVKATVNLFGHSHKFILKDSIDSLSIHLSSMSNIKYYQDRYCTPQMIEATFKFKEKYISEVDLILLNNSKKGPIIISENIIHLENKKKKHYKEQFLEVTELPKVRRR